MRTHRYTQVHSTIQCSQHFPREGPLKRMQCVSECVYVYMYVLRMHVMCVCMYARVFVCIYVRVCVCMHACVPAGIYVHIYAYAYLYTHICMKYSSMYVCMYVYIYVRLMYVALCYVYHNVFTICTPFDTNLADYEHFRNK